MHLQGRLLLLFVASIVCANAHAAYATPTCTLSDTGVSKQIMQSNAKSTLKSLFNDLRTWNSFIGCIESGKESWVDIAISLRTVSDAGASDELNSAFGEALGNNPRYVLQKVPAAIGLKVLCSSPDADDPRFDSSALSIAEIDRREKALGGVRDPALVSIVEECKASLENSKEDVERFFREN